MWSAEALCQRVYVGRKDVQFAAVCPPGAFVKKFVKFRQRGV